MRHSTHLVRALLASVVPAISLPLASAQCELEKLTAQEPLADSNLGYSVAIDGDRAVVGAPAHNVGAGHKGAVHVFEKGPSGWSETARVRPAHPFARTGFGHSVALSGDNMAVSSDYRVHFFELQGAEWTEVEVLEGIGQHISLTMHGETLLTGAINRRGRVRVYEKHAGRWIFARELIASEEMLWDGFGYATATDGETIVVGAFLRRIPNTFQEPGAAYVFERPTGSVATPVFDIPAPESSEGDFGHSVAVSEDTILVADGIDRVFLYLRAGTAWRLEETVEVQRGATQRVALSPNTAVIVDGAVPGIRILGRSATSWEHRRTIPVGGNDDWEAYPRVAMSATTVVIGAGGDDDAAPDAGAVYFLDLDASGDPYCCPAETNSTGRSGRLLVHGSRAVLDDELTLTAEGLPTRSFGTVLMSDGNVAFTPPGSSGPVCLGGGTSGILHVQGAGLSTDPLAGGFSISPGTSGLPTVVMAGTTWNFQAWYRDAAAGTTNTTNAVSVTFE